MIAYVMAMATGADLRSIQPRSNEGLSSASPTFGGTQSQVESGVLGGYEDVATVQTQFTQLNRLTKPICLV